MSPLAVTPAELQAVRALGYEVGTPAVTRVDLDAVRVLGYMIEFPAPVPKAVAPPKGKSALYRILGYEYRRRLERMTEAQKRKREKQRQQRLAAIAARKKKKADAQRVAKILAQREGTDDVHV
jgi:hypothetical protein